jgi:tetratricopeptide (TPR) repeat protein
MKLQSDTTNSDSPNSGNLFYRFCLSPYVWLIALALLTFFVYCNTLNAPFIFDDIDNIAKNPSIRFEEMTWQYIRKLSFSLNWKRPVSLFTFGLNYYFGRFNVTGYHIVNILIHLINGLLLFLIIKKTLFLRRSRLSGVNSRKKLISEFSNLCDNKLLDKASYIAIFATALWLLNPIQIFSVTYTVQRMNSLFAMFSLFCLLFYMKARSRTWLLKTCVAEPRPSTPDGGEDTAKPCRGTLAVPEEIGGQENIEHSTSNIEHRIREIETAPPHPRTTALLHYCTTIFYAFLSLFCALLAIASKQNAILIPLFILLYEFYFIQDLRFQWIKICWKRKWLFVAGVMFVLLLLAGLGAIVYYNTSSNPWQHILSLYKGRDFNLSERLFTQPRVVVYYLSLIFYPDPSRMALLVGINKSTGLLHPVTTLLSMIFLFVLLFMAIITAKRYRIFSFAILWFFIGQLLESTVIPLELVYIHRNYLPSMFLFLPIVAWLFQKAEVGGQGEEVIGDQLSLIGEEKRGGKLEVRSRKSEVGITAIQQHSNSLFQQNRFKFIVIFLTGIILLFSYWTYSYNSVWGDRLLFWEDNIEKFPGLARPHANLAAVLVDQGKFAQAHDQYRIALKIQPNDIKNLFNVGVVYEKEGKLKKALKYYSLALKQNRNFADAWCNQGNVLIDLGDFDNGLSCLYQAWELNNFDPVINYNLANALMKQNNMRGVLFHLHRAIKSDPNYVDAFMNLGIAYFQLKNFNAAEKNFKIALRLAPNTELARVHLKVIDAIKQNKLPGGAVLRPGTVESKQ